MIGEVKAVFHREIDGKIKTVTVSKNKSDQYYAAILFDDGVEKPTTNTEGKAIGIDLGSTHFAITSDGSRFDNPRWFKKHERNLKLKQQQLSRKQKAMKCGLGGFPHEQLHQEAYRQTVRRSNRGRKKSTTLQVLG